MRTVLRFVGRVVAVIVIVVGGAALVAGVLLPRLTGATPYVVLSDSMAPALPAGTLVVVRPVAPANIRIGDVVTYQLRSGEPAVATHRVVGVGSATSGEPTFVTRGDANDAADVRPVRAVQLQGSLWYSVPYLGRAGAVLTGGQRDLVVGVLVLLLLAYAARQVVLVVRERRQPGAEPKEAGGAPGGAEPAGGAPAPAAVKRSAPAPGPGAGPGPAAVGLALVVVLAGVVTVAGLQARAASAAERVPEAGATAPAVGLSLDGETWTRESVSPLFGQDLRWVPGDVSVATFYVRNESGSRARGQAHVLVEPGPRAGAEELAGELSFRTRFGDAPWDPGARPAPVVLAPGEVVPVSVEVAFAAGATNAVQGERVPLDVLVTLTELAALDPGRPPGTGGTGAVPGPGGSGACAPPEAAECDGSLAPTGPTVLPLLLLAAAAVLAGVAMRRRRG
ncbi:hypothetical protein GCM10028784_24720 [Myceligenerans cantabricum]